MINAVVLETEFLHGGVFDDESASSLMMLIERMLMMMKREGVLGTCHLNGLALRGRSAVGILFLQILTSATHKGFFFDDFDFDFDNHETMVHNITIVPLLP